MRLAQEKLALLRRLERGEKFAVHRDKVAEYPAGRRAALERPGGVDDVDAYREAVDIYRQRHGLSGLLGQLFEERPGRSHEARVVLGHVGHGDGGGSQPVAVGAHIADEERHGLKGPYHAVRGHAQQACLLGHLVDGPFPMVHVEEAEDREPTRERPDGKGVSFPGFLARGHQPPMDSWLACGARALQMRLTLRYDSYDTSNIIQQYRDIVLRAW